MDKTADFLVIVSGTLLALYLAFKLLLSKKKEEKPQASWHQEGHREKFPLEIDGKECDIEVSAAYRLRNFPEIFGGQESPASCSQCNTTLKSIPLTLSISFSGKTLRTLGKYCPKCDPKPESMHVTVTADGGLAMLR